MYTINTIPHVKCFLRYLPTLCFCVRNLTRSLRSLVRFLIQKQLGCKYRTPALSMKYSLFMVHHSSNDIVCVFSRFYLPLSLFATSYRWEYLHLDDRCRCQIHSWISGSIARSDVKRSICRSSVWKDTPLRSWAYRVVPGLWLCNRPLVSKGILILSP